MQERFAAGEFDEREALGGISIVKRAGQFADSGEDFRDSHFFALGEGVRGVAIRAAEIAGGQARENARQTGERAFPLHAQINFVNGDCFRH